jgi:hypothetical protein
MAQSKKTSTRKTTAKKPPLGSGERFKALEKSLKGKVSNPAAVAASIGRKKYGAAKMAKMSAAGRKKAK